MQVRDTMIRTVLALFSVLVMAFAATAAAARTDVTGVRLGSHPDGVTRFVMDLSAGMDFTVAALADPDRIVVATPDLAWNTAPARPFGAVLGLRYENGGAGGRIVLDLKDPATVRSAFVMSPRDGQGWRFVMDLQQTTRAAFLATVAKPKAMPLAKAAIPAPAAMSPAAMSPVAESPVTAPAGAPAPSAPQRIVLYSPEVTPPPPPPIKATLPVKVEPVAAESEAAPVVAKAEPVPVAKPKAIRAGSPMMSAPVPPPLERPQAPAAMAALSAVPAMPAIAAAPPMAVAPQPVVIPPMPQMVTKVSASLLADPDPKGLPADGRPVIVIDPGHGGVDPGAIGVSGIYEKNITLAVAREVKAALEKGNRYKVHLTRDRDVFIRLRERVALGRQYGADLFISLHADSVANPQLKGLSVYTLSQNASDSEAQALADKENKADLIAGIDLSHESADVTNILIDLAQRETMNRSAVFAGGIVDEVGRETPLLGNTHRFAGFAVLKAPDVPSVLIELGYLSNETEERNLRQPEYRTRLAKAVARSIDRFFLQGQKARRP